jgi:biotin carboxylase/MFS family permease
MVVDATGSGMYLPVSLLYFHFVTGLPMPRVGTLLTVAALVGLAATPLTGVLVDRFGARTVVVGGYLLRAVGFATYPLVHNGTAMLAVTTLVALGDRSFPAAVQALIAELVEGGGRDRLIAAQRALRNAGLGAGGLLAGLALGLDEATAYHAIVLADGASMVVAAVLIAALRTPRPSRTARTGQPAQQDRAGYRAVLRDRPFVLLTLINVPIALGYMVLGVILPVYVTQTLHQPPSWPGTLFAVNTVAVAALQVPVTRALVRRRRTRAAAFGGAVFSLSFLAFAGLRVLPGGDTALVGVFVATSLFTVGELLHGATASSLSANAAPARTRGRHLAFYQLSWSIPTAAAPALFTWLLAWSPAATWLLLAGGTAAAATALLAVERLLPAAAVHPAPATSEKRTPPMSTDRRTLLLVGGTDDHVRKAKALGLRVVLLQHPTKSTPVQAETADEHVLVDYTDWPVLRALVEENRRAWDFDAVLSLTEAGVENAARLSDLYGGAGTPHAVTALLRDKAAMRRHLAANDPDALGARLLRTRGDLEDFGARYGHPFVVKPTAATASFGVFRVDSPDDVDAVWSKVSALRGRSTDRGSTLFTVEEFLMEEFVDGPEFSVESFSAAGRHVIVAVTEKFVEPATFTELGHVVPARLGPEDEDAVRACVTRFLRTVGLTDGTCHTEVRLGARGPVVIESHNRAGGDAIVNLVEAAYGVDLVSLALARPFGLAGELPDRPEARAGASTRFLVADPGTVVSVAGAQEAARADGALVVRVTAEPGRTVRGLQDNWDRLGLVAAEGADATAAIEQAARVAEALRIDVRGTDGTVRPARLAPAPEPPRPAAERAEAVA